MAVMGRTWRLVDYPLIWFLVIPFRLFSEQFYADSTFSKEGQCYDLFVVSHSENLLKIWKREDETLADHPL